MAPIKIIEEDEGLTFKSREQQRKDEKELRKKLEKIVGGGAPINNGIVRVGAKDENVAIVFKTGRDIRYYDGTSKDLFYSNYYSHKAFCTHNDQLYVAGISSSNLYGSVKKMPNGDQICFGKTEATALCSHNGTLYGVAGKTIYDALSDKKVLTRRTFINALCSHNGKLYDASSFVIYETGGASIGKRPKRVRALCSHNGKLYDAGDDKRIFETVAYKQIARRPKPILQLATCNGVLYDAGEYGLYETMTNKQISSNPVYTMCGINKKLLNKLRK